MTFEATLAKARLMIDEIENALSRGVKHYSVDGRFLNSAKEIIEVLLEDKEIIFEVPKKEGTKNEI